jgi:hypothetical protein
MSNPERPPLDKSERSTVDNFQARIQEIERRLEIVDANENPIEREAQREELLEQLELLHDEADAVQK